MSSALAKTVLCAAALALGVAASPGTAAADQYHYRNLLVGDRAAGMGGAYTAVSDDPTGLYYNPAATVYAQGGSLSASMNTFHTTHASYADVLGGEGWERASQTLVPNFFGVLHPFGRVTVGFSYAVPDAVEEDQDQTFQDLPSALPGVRIDEYRIHFNERDNTYHLGPSVAFRLGERWAAGLTLYGHYRRREAILDQVITLDDGRFQWANMNFETEEFGLRPLAGVLWEVTDRLSVGLAAAKTFVLSAHTEVQQTATGVGVPDGTVDVDEADSRQKREYPWTATLGVAYFATHSLLLSADVTYYEAVRDEFGKRETTWDFATGLEYYPTPRWAVRLGAFSSRANTPEIDAGKTDQDPHVDLYGGSMSLSHFTRTSSVTLGAAYSRGSGEDQVIQATTDSQDLDVWTLSVFLSASYRY
ncbi:MAG: hypothetical protein Kow0092_29770 [Deferrisomatales bacterium]